jgi:hypothetical protein
MIACYENVIICEEVNGENNREENYKTESPP